MKKTLPLFVLMSLLLQACNWFKETPEVGLVLSEHFKNKLYKDFDTAVYNRIFLEHLDASRKQLSNPKTIAAYYQSREFKPAFVSSHYVNGDLDSLISYLNRSEEHGFNPSLFGLKKLQTLKKTLDANAFKTVDELYPVIADLELGSAEALSKYYDFVNFGVLNPRKILNRYYINIKKPDSLGIIKVLETKSIPALLKEVQPKSEQYIAFQKELSKYKPGVRDEKQKILLVNMERLRWKLPETGSQFVVVNIPDFSLTWFDHGDTLTRMKVCVGARREKGYEDKIKAFLKSGKLDDKPKNHETPILFSKLNSIQVNPVWNIPVSIAQSEIYYQAVRDPYYLSNSNIKVYYKGQLVTDPDTIQWNKYSREKLPFKFKQGSGAGNALGKFKFIFDNGSSIYLHDTNNKYAFNLGNRAISHGCVRVEKPLEFAEKLVNDKYQFDQLRMEVNLPPLDSTKMDVYKKRMAKKADTVNVYELKPKWFGTKKQIPLIINYVTAWWQNGSLQVRPDVYGLDETLWEKLQKFL
ncbi:L,D-transpeptidase family protein [Pedobacter nutrimenti]|uniref:L,D-transpeptidase-like protein n=1 Tax=Pedobacter nutrimenti TaxID=1241337 RepID=A0A318UBW3_9SPHI|nr:L,D-transpeptidase family protein [Pedobacter nutrimenti]PYF73864.1 L,D-transpeptidase-like protein [Pedobacter nutrimenti]